MDNPAIKNSDQSTLKMSSSTTKSKSTPIDKQFVSIPGKIYKDTVNKTENACSQSVEQILIVDPFLEDRVNNKMRGQLDIIKMSEEVSHYKYLFIYEDRISRYVILKGLRSNDTKEIAMKLLDVMSIIGVPHILQSGNGQSFATEIINQLFTIWKEFKIVPGETVKFNNERNFENIIKSWLEKNPKQNWLESIKLIQVLENATFSTTNNNYPFETFFKRDIYKDFYSQEKETNNAELPIRTVKLEMNYHDDSNFDSEINRECTDDNSTSNNQVLPVKDEPEDYDSNQGDLTSFMKLNLEVMEHINLNTDTLGDDKLKIETTRFKINKIFECCLCDERFLSPNDVKKHIRSHKTETTYVCKTCKKIFKQLGQLSQHFLTHIDCTSLQCNKCDIKFESLKDIKTHDKIHKNPLFKNYYILLDSRLYDCDKCKKNFFTKNALKRHAVAHDEKHYDCDVCGMQFTQKTSVKFHMLIHTGERNFQCQVCLKTFNKSNSLKKHMYIHNGNKPHKCEICGHSFVEKRNLNAHLTTHTNTKPHVCKICGKSYTLPGSLRQHVSIAHENGKMYQCEICAKMFKQLCNLNMHSRVHSDERPHQCHICGKSFKHRPAWNSHLAMHTNVRSFECDDCKSMYVRKIDLKEHITSVHLNIRRHSCNVCGKKFQKKSHVDRHLMSHGNSTPYQCNVCNKSCNRPDNLKRHMKTHKNKT